MPLLAFLVIGIACLAYFDRVLQRQYREEASAQSLQTTALLESFLRQRTTITHGVRGMIETARSLEGLQPRFARFASEVFSGTPDVRMVMFSDQAGVAQAVYPTTPDRLVWLGRRATAAFGGAEAMARARATMQPVISTSTRLPDGDRGMMLFDPVVRDSTVFGFVSAALSYRAVFQDALAGQLQGQFAYQVRDNADSVIARSPEYPEDAATVVRRAVRLPGGVSWTVEVAVPRFQPLVPRVLNWTIGSLLLLLVVLLVVREEAQAERYAARSLDLELLTRNLLDANVRLEERAQQIAEANRAKSRFLANVSHELRTPLNAIIGYNSLAREGVYGALPASLAGAHGRIATAAEHLMGIINEVLDLSKIEVGRMELELERVDVPALVEGIITVIEPMAAAKGLHVGMRADPDVPRISTDPRHVRQVLLNLTSNAIKFTESGYVRVRVARRGDEQGGGVVVTVEDTGIGIAAADQERIFDEFEQVRPGGRGDSLERGTGLGLSISRKLARLLGGDVVVDSTLGAGSRFSLLLPNEPTLAATAEHPAARQRLSGDSEAVGREPVTASGLDSPAGAG